MRGRLGLALVLTAALLAGGCANKTPDEKQAEAQRKAAEKQAKLAQKEADEQAKQARKAASSEAKQQQAAASEEQRQAAMAEARARRELAKATPQPQDPIAFEPQEYPDIYPDDRRNVIGYPAINPGNNQTLVDAHAKAAAAAGARADGALYDEHFYPDGQLSELGRGKVALMLYHAPQNEPLRIYVAGAGRSEDQAKARVAAVEKFVKDSPHGAGIVAQVREGMNPDNTTPAAGGLAALRRLERATSSGGDATVSGGDTTGGRGRLGADGSSSGSGSSSSP